MMPNSCVFPHGQPFEIVPSFGYSLWMSGIDRLLVGFLCPIVLSLRIKHLRRLMRNCQ
jgi:hypothetical protein